MIKLKVRERVVLEHKRDSTLLKETTALLKLNKDQSISIIFEKN